MIDLKTLRNISQAGLLAFAKGHLLDGIASLRTLLPYCAAEPIIRAEADSLEENYHHMLAFLRRGGADQKRHEVQTRIQREGIRLLEQVSRVIRISLKSDHYGKAWAALQESFGPDVQANVLEAFLSSPFKGELDGVRQDDLFDLLWTSPVWTAQDTAHWYDFLLGQRDMVQQHLAGAIFLAAWEHYDSEKVQMLNLLADSECHRTRISVASYLLLLRLRHKELVPLMPALPDNLLSRKGRKLIAQVQYEMLLMILSERDMHRELEEAESLTKKVINSLAPGLLGEAASANASPDGVKDEAEEAAPAAEKEGEKLSGEAIVGSIKDIISLRSRYLKNRLQRGMDPNLSKVPLLHHCKYLKRIAHWFLPFDKSHPLFQSILIDDKGNEKQKLSGLVDLILDCDVDKLATLYLAANDKDFSKAVRQLDEEAIPDIEDAVIPEYTIRFIMQDLYRFFLHSPLSSQLVNPFRGNQTLLDFPDLAALFAASEYLICCSLLFEIGRERQALSLLDSLIGREGASAPALLLRGQILIHLQQYTEAASCLRTAEVLQPDDADILRCLAECCAALHKFEEELGYLQRLAELFPEDITYRRLIPMTLLKAGRESEALQLFFKLDLETPEDDEDYPALVSRIADTALALGKLDVAERYTERELGIRDEELGMAQLRMGHIRLLQGDWKGSIDHYEQFINAYCKGTATDAKTALEVIESQCKDAKWLKSEMVNCQWSDIMIIHDILQAAIESPKA